MRKILLSTFIFCLPHVLIYAYEDPSIWHRPDSVIVMPQEDSIPWTDEYTIFTVVRSMHADSTECLWSFTENDTITNAVLTRGVYLPAGVLLSGSPRAFSRWCVYAYKSGIRMDSTKTHTLRLGKQLISRQDSAGEIIDTLHARIDMEELAYFKGHVSRHVSGIFQTYLALKYGITLDYAPYLSQTGDTLWHPKQNEDYYHRIIGIGNDTIHRWYSTVSQSKENPVMHIQTDSMAPNEYILLGDDNGDLSWRLDYDGMSVLRREWRLRQFVKRPHRIQCTLRLSGLNEPVDSIRLALMDANGNDSRIVFLDSIAGDSACFFTFVPTDSLMHLRFCGVVVHHTCNRNSSPRSQAGNNTGTDIYYDVVSNTIVIDGYPTGQLFTLYLYDNTGKYLSRLSCLNPVDVSTLPSSVFYVEIMVDNQIVGTIPIPNNIY